MTRPVIVHVIRSLEIGGLENGVVNLVNGTADRFEHVILTLQGGGALRSRVSTGVRVTSLDKQPGQEMRSLLRLAATIRRFRPDIVHSRNWPTVDAVVAARLAGVGTVLHGEHGREALDPDGRDVRRNRVRRLLQHFVTTFVCVSYDLRRWLTNDIGVPERKVITIHNGVDLARFSGTTRQDARARLGLREDMVAIGTVGRLDPVKDQGRLITAFAELAPRYPDAVLILAGDGPCRPELEESIETLRLRDRVRMLGDRRDVPDILAALDVFVLPSIAEGISNTILEAMASGLPVVATRVGGNPELVEDGITGSLVPAADPAALAAAIGVYLESDHVREVHGKNSRQRAVDRFSLRRMCDDYARMYGQLLAPRRVRTA